MWVNVSDNIDFTENKIIAVVTFATFANIGVSRKNIAKLINCGEFSEALVFRLLRDIGFQRTIEWKLLEAYYNPEWQSWDIVATSPRFPKTAPGGLLPRVISQEQLDGMCFEERMRANDQ